MVAFQPLFDQRVFQRALVLTVGALLAVRTRTVTAALRVTGHDDAQFSAYHRVLSRVRWSCLDAARVLLGLVVERFVPEGPIIVGCDDTIERRWGPKISARGIYRDPVRSSLGFFVKTSGLRWLSLSVLAPVSWAGRVWALPFLTVLCPSARFHERLGRAPVKLTDRARQAILQVARWLRQIAPERRVVVVADSGFAAVALLSAVHEHVTVVTRLRLDAALYGPVPPRVPGRPGRPRKRGDRLRSLYAQIADRAYPLATGMTLG
ncbi:MAG: transposase [Bacteroidota bacterium]